MQSAPPATELTPCPSQPRPRKPCNRRPGSRIAFVGPGVSHVSILVYPSFMNFDRQLARLMAAMIVMIIAYVSPSAVQAHEGHAHHGHHEAAVSELAPVPPVVQAVSASVAVSKVASAIIPAATPGTLAGSAAVGLIQSDEQGRGCCPGPCKGACCGTMSCCVSGILGRHLPPCRRSRLGHVALSSRDVDGRSGRRPRGPSQAPTNPRVTNGAPEARNGRIPSGKSQDVRPVFESRGCLFHVFSILPPPLVRCALAVAVIAGGSRTCP